MSGEKHYFFAILQVTTTNTHSFCIFVFYNALDYIFIWRISREKQAKMF